MCLIRVARDNEINITPEGVTSGLPLYAQTLTPSYFDRAAELAGLTSKVVEQSLGQINRFLLPAILLLKDNAACVIYEIDFDAQTAKVYFPELEDTVTTVDLETLQQRFTGSIIYLQQRQFVVDNQIQIEDPNQHWFWRVIRQNRKFYKDILLAALFVNLFALTMPLFIMNIYDRVVPNHATDTLWVLSLGIFLILCADFSLKLIRSYFVDLASSRSDQKLSAYIMQKVMGRRMASRQGSVGITASTIQSYEAIRSFTGSMTVVALIDLPFFVLFAVVITLMSWVFLIPLLIASLLILLYALSLHIKLKELSESMSQASNQRSSFLIESLNAEETVKSFNAQGRTLNVWEKASRHVIHYSARLRYLGGSMGSFSAWVQQSTGIAIVIIGVYLIIDGQISQGALIASYMLSTRALAPISQTASLITQYYQASNALKMLDDLVHTQQERDQMKGWISHPNLKGNIDFRNVTFSYVKDGAAALNQVSFSIKAGERVAILGKVGSGKSTIEKLIMNLYEPNLGAVLIDDTHLSQIDPAELRRQIGYIPQDIQLLNGTVFSNIVLGNPHASRAAVEQSMVISGLGKILKHQEDGLSMQVGEGGSQLSGGQRQAIAVARAIAQQANILVFDEPTSAMDANLEHHVIRHLKQHIETTKKTLILVTHKPSLLSLVDRVILMEDGKVIADAPKDVVMKQLVGSKTQTENKGEK
nr:type I secretion system permease/ATPase [Acinetobacter sp. YH12120]